MSTAPHGYQPGVPKVLRMQGAYYALGGLWPLVNYQSFERVTGPKPDRFVTEVASALYTAIGICLLTSGRRPTPQLRLLAVLSAMASVAADLRHRPAIRAVYLGDAVAETGLIVAVLHQWLHEAQYKLAGA